MPQGWLQALHELQELTVQFIIMHDDDCRLVVDGEPSATRAMTKNDQNSFDVIVSVKLQFNTPEINEITFIARFF